MQMYLKRNTERGTQLNNEKKKSMEKRIGCKLIFGLREIVIF